MRNAPPWEKKQNVTGGFSFGGICDHINHLSTLFLKGEKCMSGGGGGGGGSYAERITPGKNTLW